jgi:predicted small lipoprotein YifL
MRTALPLSLVLLALAGCAQRAPLEPAAGSSLPVAPHGANSVPDSEALLTPPPQAAPQRTVELRSRSEERADDPFDLPPE